MKPIRSFNVIPALPPAIEKLRDLAYNLRWSWDSNTIELFRRLDNDLWETSGHNPVAMLGTIEQSRLEAAASDESFIAQMQSIHGQLTAYLNNQSTWFRRTHGAPAGPLAAYFSAEFGVTDCLAIFAGGLGVLAGDMLKSCSDLDIPLVGVGLLYRQGYLRQYLNEAGWQQEVYDNNDFHNLPLMLERDSKGAPLTVEVAFPGRAVVAQIWKAQVGRIPLYLLDTNVVENSSDDQEITFRLYGGDEEMRLKQEILLGIGGCRALAVLGLEPTVYHINDGHAAFLALERIRTLMENKRFSFAEAREAAATSLILTSHTPVPAGHDRFPPELIGRYFVDFVNSLGITINDLMVMGRVDPASSSEWFCMTVLALRIAARSNAVSALHSQTARRMWQNLWPGVPDHEIPIGHVTNGIHFRSWISRELDQLYERYLGPRWRDEPTNDMLWRRTDRIPAEELWRTHELRRQRMVSFVRRRMVATLERRGSTRSEIEAAGEALDPEILTIGFARRFAAYKRAGLLIWDQDRLDSILNHPTRPVQVIFAGKAHPKDDAGKDLIRQIVALSNQERFRRRLVFLEDYDLSVARYLVQGCDIWLNTPRRPNEASGTSGMKAAANGGLNLSTLDGWWDEAWRQRDHGIEPVGWAIGQGEVYTSETEQDQLESDDLYDLLERDITAMFYDRGSDGLPRRWIARIKSSISQLCHHYNSHRMAREYADQFYLPAVARFRALSSESSGRASALAAWKERLSANWGNIQVESVNTNGLMEIEVGGQVRANALIRLGEISPDDVTVELYVGKLSPDGQISEAVAKPMQLVRADADGRCLFEVRSEGCERSGLHGITVRVLPRHPDLTTRFIPGLITWAGVDTQVT
jgi:starch phosphorylase